METGYIDGLVKRFCKLSGKDRNIKTDEEWPEQCEAWLEYEKEYKQWAKNATQEEREYFKRFIDPEWIGMTCSGIRWQREQEAGNGKG